MFSFLSPLMYLPLLELIGFIEIGGRLGLGLTLLWLVGSTMIGFSLLRASARSLMPKPPDNVQNGGNAPDQSAFDGLCLMIAGFLFIFPGFISDFLALPFLIGPVRHYLFATFGHKPDNFVHKFAQDAERFRPQSMRRPQSPPRVETIIEGDFKRLDDSKPPDA